MTKATLPDRRSVGLPPSSRSLPFGRSFCGVLSLKERVKLGSAERSECTDDIVMLRHKDGSTESKIGNSQQYFLIRLGAERNAKQSANRSKVKNKNAISMADPRDEFSSGTLVRTTRCIRCTHIYRPFGRI